MTYDEIKDIVESYCNVRFSTEDFINWHKSVKGKTLTTQDANILLGKHCQKISGNDDKYCSWSLHYRL